MRELGIDPPPRSLETWPGWAWIQRLRQSLPKTQTFTATINPTSVSANTTSEQTFTVTGLSTADIVTVNKPSHTAGLVIGNARVSAANTLAITFGNLTAAPIDPPSEAYTVKATRL